MAKVKELEPVSYDLAVIIATPQHLRTPEQNQRWQDVLRSWTADGETSYLGLPAFSTYCSCPKCGHETIASVYHRVTCIEHEHLCFRRVASHEHMHRVCGMCRYEWLERPLDAGS